MIAERGSDRQRDVCRGKREVIPFPSSTKTYTWTTESFLFFPFPDIFEEDFIHGAQTDPHSTDSYTKSPEIRQRACGCRVSRPLSSAVNYNAILTFIMKIYLTNGDPRRQQSGCRCQLVAPAPSNVLTTSSPPWWSHNISPDRPPSQMQEWTTLDILRLKGCNMVKCYVVLYTCMAGSAVQPEVAYSLTHVIMLCLLNQVAHILTDNVTKLLQLFLLAGSYHGGSSEAYLSC